MDLIARNPRLAAFLAIVLWGVSFVATRAALRDVSPLTLVVVRFALGTALVWSFLAARRLSPPTRDSWASLAVLGFVGVFVHQLLQAHGLTLTTAVKTGWLIGLIPIWSALLAVIFLQERFGVRQVSGLVVGFLGAAMVVGGGRDPGDIFTLPSTRGDLLILASTLNWAVYTVAGRNTLRRVGALRATAGAMLAGWAMLLPFFVATGGWSELTGVSGTGWTAILFLGLGASGLGYLLWFGALQGAGASQVAAFLYLEPLVTLAAAMALIGERVSASTLAGGLLVLAGVALTQHRPTSPDTL